MCRILANRQSAQRSRVRKLQYISELERSVSALEVNCSKPAPLLSLYIAVVEILLKLCLNLICMKLIIVHSE